ncbi:MAG: LexA family protein [Alphaproteobacteria bacterium]
MPPKRSESSWRPVVDAVAAYHRHNGHGPTVDEIAYVVGRSRTAVRFQLERLLEDGVLTHTPGKRRTIRLAE